MTNSRITQVELTEDKRTYLRNCLTIEWFYEELAQPDAKFLYESIQMRRKIISVVKRRLDEFYKNTSQLHWVDVALIHAVEFMCRRLENKLIEMQNKTPDPFGPKTLTVGELRQYLKDLPEEIVLGTRCSTSQANCFEPNLTFVFLVCETRILR